MRGRRALQRPGRQGLPGGPVRAARAQRRQEAADGPPRRSREGGLRRGFIGRRVGHDGRARARRDRRVGDRRGQVRPARDREDAGGHHLPAPRHGLVLGGVLADRGDRGGVDAALPVRRGGAGVAPLRPRAAAALGLRLPAARVPRRQHRGAGGDAPARGLRPDVRGGRVGRRKRRRAAARGQRRLRGHHQPLPRVSVPRVLGRAVHRRGGGSAVGGAARARSGRLHRGVDAAARVRRAGMAGAAGVGGARGRAARGADPVQVRDRRGAGARKRRARPRRRSGPRRPGAGPARRVRAVGVDAPAPAG